MRLDLSRLRGPLEDPALSVISQSVSSSFRYLLRARHSGRGWRSKEREAPFV